MMDIFEKKIEMITFVLMFFAVQVNWIKCNKTTIMLHEISIFDMLHSRSVRVYYGSNIKKEFTVCFS